MESDFEAIASHKCWDHIFDQEFPNGSGWHHSTRRLVQTVAERIDALLAESDCGVRITLGRPVIKADGDSESEHPTHWNLCVIVLDDQTTVVPFTLTEKLVVIGDVPVYVGDDAGPWRLVEHLVAEVANVQSEQSLGWI